MKKLLSLFVLFLASVIAAFLLFSDAEAAVSSSLEQPRNLISYAALSFACLVADILMPIPSSLVMILNGKVLGFAGGAILSMIASVLSSCLGFYMGRAMARVFNGFFSENEIRQGNSLFERYGDISIAVSKGIPVLSEVMSYISGSTSIRFPKFLLYSLVGHLPISLIYAWLGSYAASINSIWVSAGVISATLALFLAFRLMLLKRVA